MPPVSKNPSNEFNRSHLSNSKTEKTGQLWETKFSKLHIIHQLQCKKTKVSESKPENISPGISSTAAAEALKISDFRWKYKSNCSIQPRAVHRWMLFHHHLLWLIKTQSFSFISASLSELHNAFCFPCWLFFCLFQPLWVPILPLYMSPFPVSY